MNTSVLFRFFTAIVWFLLQHKHTVWSVRCHVHTFKEKWDVPVVLKAQCLPATFTLPCGFKLYSDWLGDLALTAMFCFHHHHVTIFILLFFSPANVWTWHKSERENICVAFFPQPWCTKFLFWSNVVTSIALCLIQSLRGRWSWQPYLKHTTIESSKCGSIQTAVWMFYFYWFTFHLSWWKYSLQALLPRLVFGPRYLLRRFSLKCRTALSMQVLYTV